MAILEDRIEALLRFRGKMMWPGLAEQWIVSKSGVRCGGGRGKERSNPDCIVFGLRKYLDGKDREVWEGARLGVVG